MLAGNADLQKLSNNEEAADDDSNHGENNRLRSLAEEEAGKSSDPDYECRELQSGYSRMSFERGPAECVG